MYCARKAVCVGALSNFSCKWMLLLPVFHFALAITWFQHKREKKKPPSLQPTLLECSIFFCAYACSFVIFQLVSNHWFPFYTLNVRMGNLSCPSLCFLHIDEHRCKYICGESGYCSFEIPCRVFLIFSLIITS